MPPRIRLPRRRSRDAQRPDARTSADGPPQLASVNGGSNGSAPPREPASAAPAPTGSGPARHRPKLKKLRFALVFLGLSVLAFVSWIFGIMMAVASDLPQLEDRAQFANAQNSVVYDVNGQKIATLTNNEGRILINSGDIAPVMKEATVSIEDQRFYEHRGVDFQGIGRAVVQDILHTGASQGASTITEQFVKNALRAQGSRTVFEKLREAALAYQLERHWDKDKILTEYLNEIYFGEGAYGIEEAAKTYFGWDHPGCGQDGEPRLRLRPPALGGGDARRGDRQPERLRPPHKPARTPPRAGTWSSRTWRTRATSRRTSTRSTPASPSRSPPRSRPRPRTPRRRTSPRGFASSSLTSTAPVRRSAAGSRSPRP